jgi:prepilin-type N-terminal cleavage/methylation domain-containing protein
MKRLGACTRMRRDGGWTLVELMIVVLIIGILLGIAVAAFSTATRTAVAVACRQNQQVLNRAISVARASGAEIDEMADLESTVENFDTVSLCPADRTPLEYDPATDSVTCPNHP